MTVGDAHETDQQHPGHTNRMSEGALEVFLEGGRAAAQGVVGLQAGGVDPDEALQEHSTTQHKRTGNTTFVRTVRGHYTMYLISSRISNQIQDVRRVPGADRIFPVRRKAVPKSLSGLPKNVKIHGNSPTAKKS